jgi:hypothetical protein
MRSTLRRATALGVLVVLLAGGGLAAYALTARPDLDDARDAASERWLAVREPLDARYARLAAANDAVRDAAGPDRDVVRDLDAAIGRWSDLFDSRDGTVADEVRAANDLEGLARRLAAVVAGSPVLRGDEAVTAALAALGETPVPEVAASFDELVRAYERERQGRLRRLAAGLLGYDELPLLDLGGAAPA